MKANIREEILKVAQDLFNEKGYRDTSMRDIANRLNISVGNLTYHFARKEDLMFALLKLPDFASRDVASTYEELFDLIKAMLDSLVINRFFYVEDELSRSTKEFYKHNIDNVSSIEKHLRKSLQNMAKLNLFVPWQKGELDAFTTMIMYSHMTWIKQSFYHEEKDHLSYDEILKIHYDLLLCRVPENKKKDYAKLAKSFKAQ